MFGFCFSLVLEIFTICRYQEQLSIASLTLMLPILLELMFDSFGCLFGCIRSYSHAMNVFGYATNDFGVLILAYLVIIIYIYLVIQ